jgi:hypothetical protein
MEVGSESDSGGDVVYFADVKRAGQFVLRIALAGSNDEASARKALATKARIWIDNFLIRERLGHDPSNAADDGPPLSSLG